MIDEQIFAPRSSKVKALRRNQNELMSTSPTSTRDHRPLLSLGTIMIMMMMLMLMMH
jgi:hypothetical protein